MLGLAGWCRPLWHPKQNALTLVAINLAAAADAVHPAVDQHFRGSVGMLGVSARRISDAPASMGSAAIGETTSGTPCTGGINMMTAKKS